MAEVVIGDQGAALAALGQFGRLGRDRLHQRGAVLPDRLLGDVGRGASLDDVAFEASGSSRNSRESDRIRSSGPTMNVSPVLPMPDSCHRRFIVIARLSLEIGNCSASTPLRPSGAHRGHEPGGGLIGGLVGAEVGDADVVDLVGARGPLVRTA